MEAGSVLELGGGGLSIEASGNVEGRSVRGLTSVNHRKNMLEAM
jgi:hypothetical protein